MKQKNDFFLVPSRINTDTIYNSDYALLRKDNNGEWDYWLLLVIHNLHEEMDENYPTKYYASIIAVSPKAAGIETLRRAADCCGVDNFFNWTEEQKVSILADYGASATLWHKEGNNYKNLITIALKESKLISSLFGFYMDKAQNRLNSNGWDFIQGNVTAGLDKT